MVDRYATTLSPAAASDNHTDAGEVTYRPLPLDINGGVVAGLLSLLAAGQISLSPRAPPVAIIALEASEATQFQRAPRAPEFDIRIGCRRALPPTKLPGATLPNHLVCDHTLAPDAHLRAAPTDDAALTTDAWVQRLHASDTIQDPPLLSAQERAMATAITAMRVGQVVVAAGPTGLDVMAIVVRCYPWAHAALHHGAWPRGFPPELCTQEAVPVVPVAEPASPVSLSAFLTGIHVPYDADVRAPVVAYLRKLVIGHLLALSDAPAPVTSATSSPVGGAAAAAAVAPDEPIRLTCVPGARAPRWVSASYSDAWLLRPLGLNSADTTTTRARVPIDAFHTLSGAIDVAAVNNNVVSLLAAVSTRPGISLTALHRRYPVLAPAEIATLLRLAAADGRVRIHTQLDPVAHGAFSAAPAGLYDDASIGAAEAAATAGQGGWPRSWLTRTTVEETYYFPTVVSV
jgi:hypothetical protein